LTTILEQTFDSRRNHMQILAEILAICKTPQPKTRILYRSNTNSKLLESYLQQLREAMLLEFFRANRRYLISAKGAEYLTMWSKLQQIIYPQQNVVLVKNRRSR